MNFLGYGASVFMTLLTVAVWLVPLYLIVRFLRAFERGVDAHARIADALTARVDGGVDGSYPPDAQSGRTGSGA